MRIRSTAPSVVLRAAVALALALTASAAAPARADTRRVPPPTAELTLGAGVGGAQESGPLVAVSADLRIGKGPLVLGAAIDLGKGFLTSDQLLALLAGTRLPLGGTYTATAALQGGLHFYSRCPLTGPSSCHAGDFRTLGVRLALERFSAPRSPPLGFWLSYAKDLGHVTRDTDVYGGPTVLVGLSLRAAASD